jgi:hypothetical protein
MQLKVKQETSLDKIRGNPGRSKSTELPPGGTGHDMRDASQVALPSGNQRRWDCRNRRRTGLPRNPTIVPVLDLDGKTLMPTCASRARRWVKQQKATPFWLNGVWCVCLKFVPSSQKKQEVIVGIDPGSKREAYTVASKVHTYCNVLCDSVDWVKEAVETRRMLRRNRRNRKTPYRKNRKNRARGKLVPSTKARWQLKLRVVNRLQRLYPITGCALEDVAAKTKQGKNEWNAAFSPLQIGKAFMEGELRKLGGLTLKRGYDTAELRKQFGLVKTPEKMALRFDAHNVDSWVLAKDALGVTSGQPENLRIVHCRPLMFRRRALHVQNPSRGGIRRSHGGTLSMGFKRGSLVKHPRHGLTTVGGTMDGRVSLHHLNGKRLCQNAKPKDLRLLKRTCLLFQPVTKTRKGDSSHV